MSEHFLLAIQRMSGDAAANLALFSHGVQHAHVSQQLLSSQKMFAIRKTSLRNAKTILGSLYSE